MWWDRRYYLWFSAIFFEELYIAAFLWLQKVFKVNLVLKSNKR